jgi:hypothetical protein
LTFFLVVAVVASMTTYFKRTIQGRIRDATFYMAKTAANGYVGCSTITLEYEPYYAETQIDRVSDISQLHGLDPSFNSEMGVYGTDDTSVVNTKTYGNQLPPALAN